MALDIKRLERVRHMPNGDVVARCPACAAEAHDRTGEHLIIYHAGPFACAKYQGDDGVDHRRLIYKLAGFKRVCPPLRQKKSATSIRTLMAPIKRGGLGHCRTLRTL